MSMFYQAENCTINIGDTTMEYIRFGTGQRKLIMLPGLGDGLRTVKGTAVPMALTYRLFAKEFTVYVFSRKNDLPEGYSTREMARDQAEAMEQLGIAKADILGVSMGAMIAQHLAIDYPEKVGKLILAVTSSRPNPILAESIAQWIALAKEGDHAAFMDSNVRRIYSEKYYRKNKWLIQGVGKITKPDSYDRFCIQADACLQHDAFEDLSKIKTQTLVIGGEQDRALGSDASRELADRIPNSQLLMYEQWGHGLYDEAEDFNDRCLQFLTQETAGEGLLS